MIDSSTQATDKSPSRPKITWVWLLLALLLLMSVSSILLFRRQLARLEARNLPDYGEAPDFQLTERSGQLISRADLAGRVWVADFIFTRCQGMCPMLSTRMAFLQQHLQETSGRAVQLISFSVDPEWDTPERLREYAERYHADANRWLFVTGPTQTVTRLITEGFHLGLTPAPSESQSAATEPIIHSDRLMLVDPALRIRGYYHGMEQESFDQLVRDVGALRRE